MLRTLRWAIFIITALAFATTLAAFGLGFWARLPWVLLLCVIYGEADRKKLFGR